MISAPHALNDVLADPPVGDLRIYPQQWDRPGSSEPPDIFQRVYDEFAEGMQRELLYSSADLVLVL